MRSLEVKSPREENSSCCVRAGFCERGARREPGWMPGPKKTASVGPGASLSQRSDHVTCGQDCLWKAGLCGAALQVEEY